MDSQIFSCHGCDRLRFSEGFRARCLEPVGSGMELSGSTGSIEYYMPYFRKQNIVFFFRATLCDITTCIPIFKAMFLTIKEIRF